MIFVCSNREKKLVSIKWQNQKDKLMKKKRIVIHVGFVSKHNISSETDNSFKNVNWTCYQIENFLLNAEYEL